MRFFDSDGTLLIEGPLSEAATTFVPAEVFSQSRPLPEAKSIAVLPFSNLTADAANESLSDGFAEEVAQALRSIRSLRVAAPTSAFSFKDREVDVHDVGRDLNVEVVLEGAIRCLKTRLLITVQLVNAKSGYLLWSTRYERDMAVTFDVAGDIARSVVKTMEIPLSSQEQSYIWKRHTENAKAHQLYLKGRYYANRLTPDGLKAGVNYLNGAITEDPDYAIAYAGLAEAYYQWSFVHDRPAEAFEQVKAAAERALDSDENLAVAHALLAVVAANYERRSEVAESRFNRALELSPGNVLVRQWYGSYLVTQGRLAAAIAEFGRARELDPLSPLVSVLLGHTYFFACQPHKALEYAHKALALDKTFWLGYWSASLAHEQLGQMMDALRLLEKANECDDSPWITASKARVYARLGQREVAEAILKDVNKRVGGRSVAPYLIATAYLALGDRDRTFEWLEKAFEEYDETLNFMAICPLMDSCRSDPRFLDLLRRAGLDNSQAKTHIVVPVVAERLQSELGL